VLSTEATAASKAVGPVLSVWRWAWRSHMTRPSFQVRFAAGDLRPGQVWDSVAVSDHITATTARRHAWQTIVGVSLYDRDPSGLRLLVSNPHVKTPRRYFFGWVKRNRVKKPTGIVLSAADDVEWGKVGHWWTRGNPAKGFTFTRPTMGTPREIAWFPLVGAGGWKDSRAGSLFRGTVEFELKSGDESLGRRTVRVTLIRQPDAVTGLVEPDQEADLPAPEPAASPLTGPPAPR
jgi:hypothetical protein